MNFRGERAGGGYAAEGEFSAVVLTGTPGRSFRLLFPAFPESTRALPRYSVDLLTNGRQTASVALKWNYLPPSQLLYAEQANRVYLVNGQVLSIYSGADLAAINTISLAALSEPGSKTGPPGMFAVDPAGEFAYYADPVHNQIVKLNLSDGSIVSRRDLTFSPTLPIIDSTADRLYLADNDGGRVVAIRLESARLSDRVPAGDWTYPAIMALQTKRVLPGYPDGYFTGKRLLSRQEFAFAIKRCLDAIVYVPPDTTHADEMHVFFRTPAEDLKTLRKLSLEFKPELMLMGIDWRADDDALLKLQDRKLHADIAEALAAYPLKPAKTADNATMFADCPPWVYDSISNLRQWKIVSSFSNRRILTRYEAAVVVKRAFDNLFIGSQSSTSSGLDEAGRTPELNDLIELHKLNHAFSQELAMLGTDCKTVDARLSAAEEYRISLEETIDTKPPAGAPAQPAAPK
jgi:hypothetical protein